MPQMKNCVTLGVATLLCTAGAAFARPGADVIPGDVTGPFKWGTTAGITGYSIGTTSCNVGTAPLNWIQNNPNHPVMAQNMYRLKNGRFEQLGQSFLKHSFCALQQTLCGSCTPFCGGCCDHLGVGCSDPYTAQRNGTLSTMGPRSQVNVFTGVFPYPSSLIGVNSADPVYRHIQVANTDLDPALNPGALFFGEGQYVARDDALALNGQNNASHRRILVGTLSGGGYNLSFTGSTVRTQPAVYAWRANGGGAGIVDPSVTISNIDVPSEGRFAMGAKVTDLLNGTWHYEYAIYNINSDRSGGGFTVPVPAGVTITNVDFHDVNYHSGEPYDNTDWPSTVGASTVEWHSPASFASNPNSNALRWSTMYNFRFDANVPPVAGQITLGLFKPGTPTSVNAAALVPGPLPGCACDYNLDLNLNSQDFFDFLAGFFAGNPQADFNNSGIVDSQDFFDFLACFFSPPVGC